MFLPVENQQLKTTSKLQRLLSKNHSPSSQNVQQNLNDFYLFDTSRPQQIPVKKNQNYKTNKKITSGELVSNLSEYFLRNNFAAVEKVTQRACHPRRKKKVVRVKPGVGRVVKASSSGVYSSDDDEEQEGKSTFWGNFGLHVGRNVHPREVLSARNVGLLLRNLIRLWAGRQLNNEQGLGCDQGRHRGLSSLSESAMSRRLEGISVTTLAIFSRLLLLGIQVFANNFLDSARHDNDGFKFSGEKGEGERFLDPLINRTFGGFANWDGQYFLHIAVKGYTHEYMLAFFPLFPLMLSVLANLVYVFLWSVASYSSLILVVSWFLNTTLFVKTANMLYDLVGVANGNVDPTAVVLLFCFNPASVFFSGMYTESLFMYLTMKVLLSLYDGRPYKALMWASLSTLCRSNGILNFGFVATYFLQVGWLKYWRERKRPIPFLIVRAMVCVVFFVPFLAFQNYAISKFCYEQPDRFTQLWLLPPYCRYDMLPYSYIQKKYWDVGFFAYFQFKQIPNFILAAPVLYLQFTKCWRKFAPLVAKMYVHPGGVNLSGLYIAAHGVLLAIFCFTFIHVQVSTRLILSAFPYLYLYIMESCGNEVVAFRQRQILWPIESTCTQILCLFYFLFGTIAFSLGYPWT